MSNPHVCTKMNLLNKIELFLVFNYVKTNLTILYLTLLRIYLFQCFSVQNQKNKTTLILIDVHNYIGGYRLFKIMLRNLLFFVYSIQPCLVWFHS